MTCPVTRRLAGRLVLGALALAVATGPAFADQSVPGVEIALGQNPGALVVNGRTGRDGTVAFADLPPGRYLVRLARPVVVTSPIVVVVLQEGAEPLVSEPISPREAAAVKKSARGYIAANGGGALSVTVVRGGPPVVLRIETRDPPPPRGR